MSLTVDSMGNIMSGTSKVGTMTSSSIKVDQSKFISGCGTITNTFNFDLTPNGFKYSESYTTPCAGSGAFSADMIYEAPFTY